MAELVIDRSELKPGSNAVERVEAATPAATEAPETKIEAPVAQDPEKKPETPPAAGAKPTNEPVITPPVDTSKLVSEKLKAIFGEDIEDEDSAREYVTRLKTPPQTENPFANDYVKGLNDYLKSNPSGSKDIYDKIITVDVKSMDHLQAIKTKMLWENPELSEADVQLLLNDKYREGDEYEDDREKQIAQIYKVTDGKSAKEYLLQLQEKHKLPDNQKESFDKAQKEKDRIESWKPLAKKLTDEFSEIEIDLGKNPEGIERGKIKFSAIDDGLKKELRKELNDIVQFSEIGTSKEDIQSMQNVVVERFIIKKFNDLVRSACDHTESVTAERIRKEYDNPTPIKKDTPPQSTTVNAADKLFDKLMGRL